MIFKVDKSIRMVSGSPEDQKLHSNRSIGEAIRRGGCGYHQILIFFLGWGGLFDNNVFDVAKARIVHKETPSGLFTTAFIPASKLNETIFNYPYKLIWFLIKQSIGWFLYYLWLTRALLDNA